jgi:large subunit ribosomal protein L31
VFFDQTARNRESTRPRRLPQAGSAQTYTQLLWISARLPGRLVFVATAHYSLAPARDTIMKAEIHPNYAEIKVTCSCGNEFVTRSTLGEDLQVEVCSSCHPFYTGKQKIVDSGGRVDKFRKRYARTKTA